MTRLKASRPASELIRHEPRGSGDLGQIDSVATPEPKPSQPKGKYGAVYRELWFLQLMADPELVPRYFKVAVVLAIHMNSDTGVSFPGRKTVSTLANVSNRTIDRAMNFFEIRGHLKRQTIFKPGKGRDMRCWPILDLSKLSLSGLSATLVHRLRTKVAQEPLIREPIEGIDRTLFERRSKSAIEASFLHRFERGLIEGTLSKEQKISGIKRCVKISERGPAHDGGTGEKVDHWANRLLMDHGGDN